MFSWMLGGALAESADQTAETTPAWTQTVFEKFGETPTSVWIIVVVLIAMGAVLLAITRTEKNGTRRCCPTGR